MKNSHFKQVPFAAPSTRENRKRPDEAPEVPTPVPTPRARKIPAGLDNAMKMLRVLVDQNALLQLLQQNLRFTLFLVAIALLYIWNSHQAERQARKADRLLRELRELRTEYMTLGAQLSTSRQQSNIALVVDSMGLKPSKQPPYKLIVPAAEE